ncbi:MAG: type II secretion system protein GspN [Bdellovibrionales bacterium]|nr:type II secretion system protein GspN [Bdellovibrionales bacterium]
MTPLLRKLLLIDLFKYHKLKMFSGVFFFILILAWIFPFSDLSDLVTNQVAKATQGRVFVQFGRLDFGILPTFSIEGEDVLLETASFPSLHIDRIQFWPSLTSLLSLGKNPNQIPGFSLRASGLFDGDVFASVSSAKSKQEDMDLKQVDLNAQMVNLGELSPLLSLPVRLQGQASLKGDLIINPQMRVQPDGNITLTGSKIRVPSGNLPTQMGPVFLPGFSWSQISVKTRLSEGVVYLEQAVLGDVKDGLFLQAKGQIRAPMSPRGTQVQSFDLKIDLQVSPSLQKELGSFLFFLDRFKRSTGGREHYVFRAVSNNLSAPPNLMPLGTF